MLRRVRSEGQSVTDAAATFGFSRPSWRSAPERAVHSIAGSGETDPGTLRHQGSSTKYRAQPAAPPKKTPLSEASHTPATRQDPAAHYEQLRRDARGRPTDPGESSGLALFLRRGMTSWISTTGGSPMTGVAHQKVNAGHLKRNAYPGRSGARPSRGTDPRALCRPSPAALSTRRSCANISPAPMRSAAAAFASTIGRRRHRGGCRRRNAHQRLPGNIVGGSRSAPRPRLHRSRNRLRPGASVARRFQPCPGLSALSRGRARRDGRCAGPEGRPPQTGSRRPHGSGSAPRRHHPAHGPRKRSARAGRSGRRLRRRSLARQGAPPAPPSYSTARTFPIHSRFAPACPPPAVVTSTIARLRHCAGSNWPCPSKSASFRSTWNTSLPPGG